MVGQAVEHPAAAAVDPNSNKDIVLAACPREGVACLSWSPVGPSCVAAGSWDGCVRLWDVPADATSPVPLKLKYHHGAPVLSCSFSGAELLLSAGCDHLVKSRDLQANAEQIVGRHDAPVKTVCWLEEQKLVASASWDKTLRLWDRRQKLAAMTLPLPERCYAMDVKESLMVVGCAERHVLTYDLDELVRIRKPKQHAQTALKQATRCIACFPDQSGYAVGSVEGRVSIVSFKDPSTTFSFKCHRLDGQVLPVNDIHFHPNGTSLATVGGDGNYVFWCKDSRQRLQQFRPCHAPVVAGKFSPAGDLFAYAVCYDWSRGVDGDRDDLPRAVLVHRVLDSEVRSKSKKTTS